MGRKRRRPWGRSHKAGCPRKGLFSQLNVFELMFFLVFSQEASCLVLAFACIMRRTWRLIKRWVLPFLPGSSSFPFPGGLGRGTSLRGLVALGLPAAAPVIRGREGTEAGALARPVGLSSCVQLFYCSPFPLPSARALRQAGVCSARESQSLDGEPENNRGKNRKLCQGLWGKNIDVSNKGPACVGERGLHVRPDCVAFTHGEEMSAWYWPKFIL